MIEESGPPAPKVLRLLYFVGAGIICTAAINKWRELEKKSLQQNQLQKDLLDQNPSNAVNKAFK